MVIADNFVCKMGEKFSQVLLTLQMWIRFVRGAAAEAQRSPDRQVE